MTPEELEKAYDRLVEAQAGQKAQDDPELRDCIDIVRMMEADQEPLTMPRHLEFRDAVMGHVKQKRKPAKAWWAGFAVAAALLMFVFLPKSEDQQAEPEIQIAEDTMNNIMEENTRQSMLAYLDETERLLVSMRDLELYCNDNEVDLSPEKTLANQLLLKQRFFANDVNRPQFVQARQLLDQLEHILVDLNTLDPCADPFELEILNEHITKKRILNKVRLIAQDIQLS